MSASAPRGAASDSRGAEAAAEAAARRAAAVGGKAVGDRARPVRGLGVLVVIAPTPWSSPRARLVAEVA